MRARTGISGTTNQNANAYGRWGSSTISGPNQTVHRQSRGNARGSTGSFSSSTGAAGAGVKGAGGNSAGGGRTGSGDVYAGADGNVYKKTPDGWEKYNNGSWNPVQKPANAPQQRPTSTTTAPKTAALGAGRFPQGAATHPEQLDHDYQARLGWAQRQHQRGAARESAGGPFMR